MNNKILERERIINQLQKTTSENEPFFKSDLEAIADWHLAEVKRIVEPYIATLKRCENFLDKKEWGTWSYMEGSQVYSDIENAKQDVKQTLKLAGGE